MKARSIVIAIDGPAAAGKGTLARRIAEHLGYAYLDTGLIYRAVGLKTIESGADPGDVDAATSAARALGPEDLTRPELRGDEAANAASKVAVLPSVRAALLDFQRRFAASPPGGAPGAVLDGRDVGTVVCPDADWKLFVTASLEVRADRRVKELRERGVRILFGNLLNKL
jgi:cytidylate kinase